MISLKNKSILPIAKILYDWLNNVSIYELFEKQLEVFVKFLFDLDFMIDDKIFFQFTKQERFEINKGILYNCFNFLI